MAEDAPYIKHLVGGIAVEVDLLIDVGFVVLFPDDIQFLMFHFYFLISSIRKAGSPFMNCSPSRGQRKNIKFSRPAAKCC